MGATADGIRADIATEAEITSVLVRQLKAAQDAGDPEVVLRPIKDGIERSAQRAQVLRDQLARVERGGR